MISHHLALQEMKPVLFKKLALLVAEIPLYDAVKMIMKPCTPVSEVVRSATWFCSSTSGEEMEKVTTISIHMYTSLDRHPQGEFKEFRITRSQDIGYSVPFFNGKIISSDTRNTVVGHTK